MSQTVWRYRGEENPDLSKALIQAAQNSTLLAHLLHNRGFKDAQSVETFLNLPNYQPTPGTELPNMTVGIERTLKALDTEENILVYGDFDVDGQTGTAILYSTLKHLGAKVSYYIPDRATEGHGLNTTALCRLVSSRKIKLVITTDTGITDFKEVSLLNGLGVDTIVTDHHDLPENLPPSVANINPKLMDDENHPLYPMCGAGVAFKFCEILLNLTGHEDYVSSLYDLAAIGTVVDMMPLIQENRWLVWRGLETLRQKGRPGIQALLEQAWGSEALATNPINSDTIGFVIGPRLNAIGRLERADNGVELLMTDDPEKARSLATHLEALNRRRQEMCEKTLIEAEQYLVGHGGLNGEKVIILASPDWHPGIIGLVATRLKDKYHVPVFMMIVDKEAEEVRCSARSIDGFHLHEALCRLQHYFSHFGGHAGAGGFALKLDQLNAFKKDLYSLCNQLISPEQMKPIIEVDAPLLWHQMTPGLLELMDTLEPCGQANPRPLFVLEKAQIGAQKSLGEGGKHLKVILVPDESVQQKGPGSIEALYWQFGQRKLDAKTAYRFVVAPENNTFRNQSKLQLIIKDLATTGSAVMKTEGADLHTTPILQDHEGPTIPFPSIDNIQTPVGTTGVHNWVDHRSREGLDSFVGQLMLPSQENQTVAFYHEGEMPPIPFLDPALLMTRQSVRSADTLILWDLPASSQAFQTVFHQVQPATIHLVGGKFQSAPIHVPAREVLKQIFQHLKQVPANDGVLTLDVDTLATALATTPAVIWYGLILLQRMTLIAVEPINNPEHSLTISLLPNTAAQKHELSHYFEFIPFQAAINEVGEYRDFLLTAPLSVIKQSILAHPLLKAPVARSSQPLQQTQAAAGREPVLSVQ